MGKYVTAAEVIQEGASASTTRIDARIAKWEAIVERVTRNIFTPTEPGELTFDGNNARILHFNIPLIEVTSLKINDEDTDLDTDEYRAHTGIEMPQDDRPNPKISLTGVNRDSIFRKTRAIFIKGLDQKITAKWGYVDPGETAGTYVTPPAIKDAIIRLVIMDLDGVFSQQAGGVGSVPISPIRREKTDDHEIEYMEIEDQRIIFSAIPRDIWDILMLYRGPWNIAAPDPRVFRSVVDVTRIIAF